MQMPITAIGLLTVVGGAVAATYFPGGFFSVAATALNAELINAALIQVRTAMWTPRNPCRRWITLP